MLLSLQDEGDAGLKTLIDKFDAIDDFTDEDKGNNTVLSNYRHLHVQTSVNLPFLNMCHTMSFTVKISIQKLLLSKSYYIRTK